MIEQVQWYSPQAKAHMKKEAEKVLKKAKELETIKKKKGYAYVKTEICGRKTFILTKQNENE